MLSTELLILIGAAILVTAPPATGSTEENVLQGFLLFAVFISFVVAAGVDISQCRRRRSEKEIRLRWLDRQGIGKEHAAVKLLRGKRGSVVSAARRFTAVVHKKFRVAITKDPNKRVRDRVGALFGLTRPAKPGLARATTVSLQSPVPGDQTDRLDVESTAGLHRAETFHLSSTSEANADGGAAAGSDEHHQLHHAKTFHLESVAEEGSNRGRRRLDSVVEEIEANDEGGEAAAASSEVTTPKKKKAKKGKKKKSKNKERSVKGTKMKRKLSEAAQAKRKERARKRRQKRRASMAASAAATAFASASASTAEQARRRKGKRRKGKKRRASVAASAVAGLTKAERTRRVSNCQDLIVAKRRASQLSQLAAAGAQVELKRRPSAAAAKQRRPSAMADHRGQLQRKLSAVTGNVAVVRGEDGVFLLRESKQRLKGWAQRARDRSARKGGRRQTTASDASAGKRRKKRRETTASNASAGSQGSGGSRGSRNWRRLQSRRRRSLLSAAGPSSSSSLLSAAALKAARAVGRASDPVELRRSANKKRPRAASDESTGSGGSGGSAARRRHSSFVRGRESSALRRQRSPVAQPNRPRAASAGSEGSSSDGSGAAGRRRRHSSFVRGRKRHGLNRQRPRTDSGGSAEDSGGEGNGRVRRIARRHSSFVREGQKRPKEGGGQGIRKVPSGRWSDPASMSVAAMRTVSGGQVKLRRGSTGVMVIAARLRTSSS